MQPNFIKAKNRYICGNMIVAVCMFIAIMSVLLKMCFEGTLQEGRLTSVFVKESQAGYIIENALQLGRDYIRNFISDAYSPNALLSPNALREVESTFPKTLNNSYVKNQIVPDNFDLSVNAFSIDCGPVFFKDTKLNQYDERYRADIALRANLTTNIPFLGTWNLFSCQKVEVDRNPLCDFQIFSEGDTTFLTGREFEQFEKIIHINGNCRFGPSSNNGFTFNKKLSVAGHIMQIDNSSKQLPNQSKNFELSTSLDAVYKNYTPNLSSNGYVKIINCADKTTKNYSYNNSYFASNSYLNKFFEHESFNRWKCGLTTRNNTYRPSGFDPTMCESLYSNLTDNDSIVEFSLGMYNLINSRTYNGSSVYHSFGQYSLSKVNVALKNRRISNLYSSSSLPAVVQKLALVESQKLHNQPGITIAIKSNATSWLKPNCYVFSIKSPYVLCNKQYINSDLPTFKWSYEDILLSEVSIIDSISLKNNSIGDVVLTPTLNSFAFHQSIKSDNRLNYYKTNITTIAETITNGEPPIGWDNVFKTKTINSAVTSTNPFFFYNTSPSTWYLSNTTQPNYWQTYKFIYDNNRRMFVQLLEFDVGAFITKLASLNMSCSSVYFGLPENEYTTMSSFINKLGQNNRSPSISGSVVAISTNDIRANYQANRMNFISKVFNDDGTLKSGVTNNYAIPQQSIPIGVGIIIVNAKKLPINGLTIGSLFPVYIKGDFNTIDVNQKACICADSVTVLSSSFKDELSVAPPSTLTEKPSSSLTINAHIITGTPNPSYMPTVKNAHNLIPEAGFLGGIRILENWGNNYINIGGSLLLPFKSKIQWEPFVPLISTSISYEQDLPRLRFTNTINGTPAGMPFYYRVSRGYKTKIINAQQNASLTNIYNTNWNNDPFANYQNAISKIIN